LDDDEVSDALLGRLASAAGILLRHAGAYSVLIRSDLNAASAVLRRRMTALAVLCVSLLLALQVGCGALLGATWNTPARVWVVAGLLAVLVACAAWGWWRLQALAAAQQRAAATRTASEWAKDRALLGELIARLRAQAR
jgi:thiol:disulfide interchange protein